MMKTLYFKDTRLDAQQRFALQTALENVNATVYLFGSMVNPHARGGDVDALFVLKEENRDVFKTMLQVSKKYQT